MQLKKLPSIFKRFEKFVTKLVFIILFLDVPLLLFSHFYPVSSHVQAIYCIAMVVIAFIGSTFLTYKLEGGFSNKERTDKIKSGQVQVIHAKTTRAIKRQDPEDFGSAFYVEVFDKGVPKTLYLWGPYLDEVEEENFPNTEFEIVIDKDSRETVEFKMLGKYLKEEKVLPPFTDEILE